MNQIKPMTALPLARIAVGAGAYAAPEVLGKVFGFDLAQDHSAAFMARLFGIRDLALGVGTLASNGDAKGMWWKLGIVCDAADAATGVLGYKAGASKRGAVMTIVVAAGAVGLGIAASRAAA